MLSTEIVWWKQKRLEKMVRKSVVRKLNNMVLNISESVIPFPIE